MALLLALHAVVAACTAALARLLGPRVFFLAGLAPAAALGWVAFHAPQVLRGEAIAVSLPWAPSLQLMVALRLDGLALLMVALVSGVGLLVLVYSRYYFDGEPGQGRMAGLLVAFAGAMLGLVVADNLVVLYVFWELTTVFSFLLIAHDDADETSRRAAVQAFLTTTGLGLVMLVGFILLGQSAGTYQISALIENPPAGGLVPVALVLVLLGAFAKSAQVPFHTWLPAAMVAPTPVSAYLHAAAMVKAGVYLVARLAPAFADAAVWRPLVVTVGVATMLVGGWRALRQYDLKRLLAFGTISQLGFLMTLLGIGDRTVALGGAALLLAHGLFKATLFLISGVVEHGTGTRRIDALSGLGRMRPWWFVIAAGAAASMAGLPPFAGYVAKEAALHGLESGPEPWSLALAGVVAGSVLTVAYTARFLHGTFAGRVEPAQQRPHPQPAGFLAPVAVLSAAGLVAGLLPHQVDALAAGHADAYPLHEPYHLALWHGFTSTLGISAATLLAGFACYPTRDRVESLQARVAAVLPAAADAQAGYRHTVAVTEVLALRLTSRTQVGSLPTYLTVVLLTLLTIPGVALAVGAHLPERVYLWDTPMQGMLAIFVLASAGTAAVARRRFTAVLLASAAGYGVGALFVVHGALDLALTQFLVETLVFVALLLVLRQMPAEFGDARRPARTWAGTRVRLAVASLTGLVGAFVAFFALAAGGARERPNISRGFFPRAQDAGGENIVNLILVDFRALDTLGEITVLAVASVGLASLVLPRWRGGTEDHDTPALTGQGEDMGIPEEDEQERETAPLTLERTLGGSDRP